MQGPVVAMLIILASLGGHSNENENVDLPPAIDDTATERYAEPVVLPVNPSYVAEAYNAGYAPRHSVGHILHETLVSFFLGHDDDVMTAQQIEAAVNAGAYSGLPAYPPSAVLSFEGPR